MGDTSTQENQASKECNAPSLEPQQPLSGKARLRSWLNRTLKVCLSDGRVLVGVFLCTDADANIILGNCSEYAGDSQKLDEVGNLESTRMLGHAMVPGKYIKAVFVDAQEGRHRGN